MGVHPVGLIVGKGFTKGAGLTCSTRFRSVAARWNAAAFDAAFGALPSQISLEDGSNWLVGEDVVTFAPNQAVALTDRRRYDDTAFVAMARRALVEVVREGEGSIWLRSGMPTAWYRDRQARQALEDALRTAAAPWGVEQIQLSPESAGGYFALLFAGGRIDRSVLSGSYGVIDWGFADVNVALFVDGRYARGESVAIGLAEALRTIQRLIASDPSLRLELSLPQVDAALRAGGIFVDGCNRPLPSGTQEALDGLLTPVLAVARNLWPDAGRTLNGIILSGGSVVPFAPALWAEFPQILIPGATELPTAISRARETMSALNGATSPQRIRAALAAEHQPTAEAIRRAVAVADPQMVPAIGFAYAAAVESQAAALSRS